MNRDEVIEKVLPQFFPEHWLNPPGMAFSDFPSCIRIGYVMRGRSGYSYLMDRELEETGISIAELHAAALDNLTRLPSGGMRIGKVPGGAEGWIEATEDNFAAARILLPQVQEHFAEELGEPFLFSLSHRDDCFCWSMTQAEERQQKHIREALEQFREDDYNLTPDILCWSRKGFSLYSAQVAEAGGMQGADDSGESGSLLSHVQEPRGI